MFIEAQRKEKMNWIIVVEVLAVLVLLPFTGFALAKLNLFFTFLETGNIKYIYHGDTLVRTIADVRGRKIEIGADGHSRLVIDNKESQDSEKSQGSIFGLFWVGIPPFASVKKFPIKRRKEEEELAGKPPTEWIRKLDTKTEDSLRGVFPRPFLLTTVELGDRQTVNLLVVGKFAVVDTYIPVPELKGEFFELTGSLLRGAVIDILGRMDRDNPENTMTVDRFLDADKGDSETGILWELVSMKKNKPSDFNNILEQRVGLHLIGATIPRWDPSDEEVRKAMIKQFIAEKEREAVIINADAYKKKIGIEAKADANAIKLKATARGIHVRKTLEAIAAQGGNPDELVKAAAKILRAESLPNLTSLVEEGGAAMPTIPMGGRTL
jgi:regulator of protease activity HflC (stomatin/prohibitin superfamily)